ncbi:unnamed protein product [Gongylonema pulchrum]|uniref:Uncharacterized protein n=1 Tax=Gongylonema pulchrum TaxID=637853 RepID=A0A183DXY8_9BILA|nr:unnamed protein product [Gongylonema pulchrum]
MSGRKGRATRRAGRGATKRSEAVLPGGAAGGQSRLTAYFSTAPHRDTSRSRIKRLGEVTSGDDAALRKQTTAKGDTPAPSQSPTKMARLKSPRTSSASAKAEASIAEWVLPPLTTRPSKSEADAAVVKDGKHRGFATAGEAETFGLEESDSGCTKEEKRSLNRMEKSVAQAEAVPVPGPSKSPADDLSLLIIRRGSISYVINRVVKIASLLLSCN